MRTLRGGGWTMSGIKLDPDEVERLAAVAWEAFAASFRSPRLAVRAAVVAVLADPAVLAAAWRAGAEAGRDRVLTEIGDFVAYPAGSPWRGRPLKEYVAEIPRPAYPGGAKGGEEG
jgi:hypothetical protein